MPQPVELPEYIHRNAMGIARENLRLRKSDWGSEAKRIVSPKFVRLDVYYDALEPLKPLEPYEFVDSHRVCNCYKPRW
ncbi:unnamed protein product [Caenorhabditis nigoni]